MNNEVEFVEDKTFLTPLPETKIPEKSIEGWFYKNAPGSIGIKKLLLLILIIGLFTASVILFLMSRTTSVDRFGSLNFNLTTYEIS